MYTQIASVKCSKSKNTTKGTLQTKTDEHFSSYTAVEFQIT